MLKIIFLKISPNSLTKILPPRLVVAVLLWISISIENIYWKWNFPMAVCWLVISSKFGGNLQRPCPYRNICYYYYYTFLLSVFISNYRGPGERCSYPLRNDGPRREGLCRSSTYLQVRLFLCFDLYMCVQEKEVIDIRSYFEVRRIFKTEISGQGFKF